MPAGCFPCGSRAPSSPRRSSAGGFRARGTKPGCSPAGSISATPAPSLVRCGAERRRDRSTTACPFIRQAGRWFCRSCSGRSAGPSDSPPDPLTLKHVVAVMSGVSVGLTALLAFVLAGRGAMVIASFLGMFHFGHMVQAAAPNSEPLYGLAPDRSVAMRRRCLRNRPHPGFAVGWGVLAGFTTIVRAEFALCACSSRWQASPWETEMSAGRSRASWWASCSHWCRRRS